MGSRPHPIFGAEQYRTEGNTEEAMNLIKKIIPVTALLVAFAVPAQALAAPKGKVQFGHGAYAVAEDDASGVATITVIRRNVPKPTLSQSVLVDYATSDGTAKAGV